MSILPSNGIALVSQLDRVSNYESKGHGHGLVRVRILSGAPYINKDCNSVAVFFVRQAVVQVRIYFEQLCL